MCYGSGPLISPETFRRVIQPAYTQVCGLCREHGVDTIWVDTDGKLDQLIPPFLEAGVNCMYPFEVGTWGADPIEYRRRFGRRLLMAGGFDKRLLARGPEAIEPEIERLKPLVDEGGYLPFCDHYVPPDVSLESFLFYIGKAREIWCEGRNLQPAELTL